MTGPAGEVVTHAEAADRLRVTVPRVRRMVAEGVLDDAGPGLVTAASVEREVARRGDMVARGEWLTFADAGPRLGVDAAQAWTLTKAGVLDRAGPGMVTVASVDREVARRAEAVAS